jgi:cell division protease FtsH
MRVTENERVDFFLRKAKLEEAKGKLKIEFVGLNDIIDEVIDLMEPWYLFPSGQVRPTIINLWGMTGVGKTSLIKRLFELIDLRDNLYKFDVGDYASKDDTKLSFAFSEKLKNRENHPLGIIFDEFQLGRTIDEHGNELEKSGLRAMWDLLDSGKLSMLQSSFYGTKVYQLTLKLEDCVQNGDVEVKNGIITKNKSYHEKYFKDESGDDVIPSGKSKSKKKSEDFFVPNSFIWYIHCVWEYRFISEREVREHLRNLDHNETLAFLNDTLNAAFKPIEFSYSSSCIFVIGNIDEAYRMAKNIDPDSDADRFYRNSLKITLPQIKSSLQKRFRSEQIARLGNNHVIYPAFSSNVYRELISLELNKTAFEIKDKFDINVKFHSSINHIIYKEGVFPTQGARPVFTTISSLIKSYIGKIVKDILDNQEEVDSISWKFSGNKNVVTFMQGNRRLFTKKYSVRLKVESLRQSDSSELQAQVAVHEAGHAVAAIYAANIIPEEIVSKTANMSEGHCSIEIPTTSLNTKEHYEKDIIISLGGYVAEKVIFGDEKIADGTGSDIQRATQSALQMAKSFGMIEGAIPMLYGQRHANFNSIWNSSQVDDKDNAAEQIVKSMKEKCEKIISKEKYLLLKIAEYLSTNSRMDRDMIIEYVNNYGSPVEIKTKENYHEFKSIIAKSLEDEEKSFRPKRGIASRFAINA